MSCDGVQFFDNSEQAECIPLCVIVHSVSECSDRSRSKPIILQKRSPIIVGVAHCKEKPDVNLFLSAVIAEFKRLDPNNDDITTIGHQFTASLRCVIADWPMWSYLKRVKGHTGYWSCERCIQPGVACEINSNNKNKTKKKKKTIQFLELDAAPRSDEEFLSYCKSDDCPDEHLNGHNDLSPFLDLNFPMVTGFVVEPMHTFYAGCVGGRLKGLAYNPNEHKLSSSQLKQVDQRLKLFEKCKPLEFERHVRSLSKSAKKYKHHEIRNMLMYIFIPVFSGILQEEHLENILLLQYAMLLIGGFVNEPVSQDNLRESSRVLKMYVQQLKQFNYPIRPTTHFASHLPEDALKYGCGIEALSAFVFENFYRFFRNILASGNLPLEQIRNKLVERSKYLLPTSADGMIINSSMLYEIEIKKFEVKTSGQKILVNFSEWKGIKKMVFSDFVLTNRFPNNVCLFKNGNVVVCSDFIEFPKMGNNFLVVGFLFQTKEHACVKPYLSTKYNTFIVSKLDERIGEWNINNLLCKMYTVPYKLTDYAKLPDITLPNVPNRWFTTPIRHTIL
ncbi:uncharacterized protein LOC123469643 [Daphnia magna]|uniref:uncharacterized protein LOC123469643 n=1 Tax=Daphnia magna TaxID=35525 RepID=UPI001E1BA943|nr:uncharacterized protein LOC123469643 [Daphnia magna]